jgi:hypothetical protein
MTRRCCAAALLVTFWLTGIGTVEAGLVDAPGENLEVSLVTYGPGDIYWERFGHNAIEIRDAASGQAVNFNYGIFDFDERGFLLNFARGHMHYMIDAVRSDLDEQFYVDGGRSVTRQQLALSGAQAAMLRDFLLWNMLPENARYNYDYLTDNCSTRVRDALNRVLDGRLQRLFTQRAAGMTYREQIDRLMGGLPWMMLPMDLGLGPFADQPLTKWQESFLPVVLQEQLRSARIGDRDGVPRPLIAAEQVIAPNRLIAPSATPPDLRPPLSLAGLTIAALIVVSRRRLPLANATLAVLYLLLAGLAGLFLLGLWALTLHRAAWANANLLLFNPLAFALLRPAWRSRRGVAASRFAGILIAAQLSAAAFAVMLHAMPFATQRNQPWLLFAIPIWCALAWSLLAHDRRFHARQPSA